MPSASLHRSPLTADGSVPASADAPAVSRSRGSRPARLARELARNEARIFRAAAGVIVIAVADDAFVHPESGTSAADHLASGLIPIALALIAALAYPRLRAGVRAWTAV